MDKDNAKKKLMSGIKRGEDGCWVWQRGRFAEGYGAIVIEKKTMSTHRLSWILFRGDIPKRTHVCHNCDNPPCCNPDHLFLGTTQDNTADRHEKGRDASGQKNGNAKLTDDEVTEIRQRYEGKYGQLTRLAEEYAVSVDQIRNIVRGKQRMTGIANKDWKTCRLRRKGNEHLGGRKRNNP